MRGRAARPRRGGLKQRRPRPWSHPVRSLPSSRPMRCSTRTASYRATGRSPVPMSPVRPAMGSALIGSAPVRLRASGACGPDQSAATERIELPDEAHAEPQAAPGNMHDARRRSWPDDGQARLAEARRADTRGPSGGDAHCRKRPAWAVDWRLEDPLTGSRLPDVLPGRGDGTGMRPGCRIPQIRAPRSRNAWRLPFRETGFVLKQASCREQMEPTLERLA